MGFAKTSLPAEDATDREYRLERLGAFLNIIWRSHDAMQMARPLAHATQTLERLKGSSATDEPVVCSQDGGTAQLTEKKASKIVVFGDFTIEATGQSTGWRITTRDQATGVQHEFYVHEGHIHHVNCHSSPWNHSTQFVVGARVKRIIEPEKQAILRAIRENARLSNNV